MADETTASVIPLHQVPPKKKRAKTSAGRSKANRQRKKSQPAENAAPPSSDHLIPLDFQPADAGLPVPSSRPRRPTQLESAASPPAVALQAVTHITAGRRLVAPILLQIAALALAAVGITMNGWFARSLGSTDASGWLFFAVGVAADLVALVMPSCAASLWQARQRTISLAGWVVWTMTFVFAITAGIGFASLNIADVTASRASRTTPAVATAQAALTDAMAARDRECKGGVGKFCREREAVVNERRQALDVAMHQVEQIADPQTDAAIRIVAWISRGVLRPTGDDFAMLRLILIAMLPQIGGILFMVGRLPSSRIKVFASPS
jgi:hypothetical protein